MTEDVKKEPDSQQEEGKRDTSIPNDGSFVPRERLNDVLEDNRLLRGDNDQLRGQVSTQQTPPTPEREYTRSELGQKVEDGAMSQEEAGRILDTQADRRTKQTVTAAVREAVSETTGNQRLQAQVDSYTAAIPEVAQTGSEARKKVEKEYQYLTGLGHPQSVATEVAALRAAFGPADLIRSGKPAQETHQETGGSDESDDGGSSDGPPKGLSRDAKKHYGDQIDRGMYADWAAVSKELEGASASVKARLGI